MALAESMGHVCSAWKMLLTSSLLLRRTVDRVAQALHKAGKIKDLCEGAGFFERLTLLERQFPSASVLVHKQGVLPPEIAALWSSPQLMSAARQFLGGGCCSAQTLYGSSLSCRGPAQHASALAAAVTWLLTK